MNSRRNHEATWARVGCLLMLLSAGVSIALVFLFIRMLV